MSTETASLVRDQHSITIWQTNHAPGRASMTVRIQFAQSALRKPRLLWPRLKACWGILTQRQVYFQLVDAEHATGSLPGTERA